MRSKQRYNKFFGRKYKNTANFQDCKAFRKEHQRENIFNNVGGKHTNIQANGNISEKMKHQNLSKSDNNEQHQSDPASFKSGADNFQLKTQMQQKVRNKQKQSTPKYIFPKNDPGRSNDESPKDKRTSRKARFKKRSKKIRQNSSRAKKQLSDNSVHENFIGKIGNTVIENFAEGPRFSEDKKMSLKSRNYSGNSEEHLLKKRKSNTVIDKNTGFPYDFVPENSVGMKNRSYNKQISSANCCVGKNYLHSSKSSTGQSFQSRESSPGPDTYEDFSCSENQSDSEIFFFDITGDNIKNQSMTVDDCRTKTSFSGRHDPSLNLVESRCSHTEKENLTEFSNTIEKDYIQSSISFNQFNFSDLRDSSESSEEDITVEQLNDRSIDREKDEEKRLTKEYYGKQYNSKKDEVPNNHLNNTYNDKVMLEFEEDLLNYRTCVRQLPADNESISELESDHGHRANKASRNSLGYKERNPILWDAKKYKQKGNTFKTENGTGLSEMTHCDLQETQDIQNIDTNPKILDKIATSSSKNDAKKQIEDKNGNNKLLHDIDEINGTEVQEGNGKSYEENYDKFGLVHEDLEIKDVQTNLEVQEGIQEIDLEHERANFWPKILSELKIEKKNRERKCAKTEIIKKKKDVQYIDENCKVMDKIETALSKINKNKQVKSNKGNIQLLREVLETKCTKVRLKGLEIKDVETDKDVQEGNPGIELDPENVDFEAKILPELKMKKLKRNIANREIQDIQDMTNISTNSGILDKIETSSLKTKKKKKAGTGDNELQHEILGINYTEVQEQNARSCGTVKNKITNKVKEKKLLKSNITEREDNIIDEVNSQGKNKLETHSNTTVNKKIKKKRKDIISTTECSKDLEFPENNHTERITTVSLKEKRSKEADNRNEDIDDGEAEDNNIAGENSQRKNKLEIHSNSTVNEKIKKKRKHTTTLSSKDKQSKESNNRNEDIDDGEAEDNIIAGENSQRKNKLEIHSNSTVNEKIKKKRKHTTTLSSRDKQSKESNNRNEDIDDGEAEDDKNQRKNERKTELLEKILESCPNLLEELKNNVDTSDIIEAVENHSAGIPKKRKISKKQISANLDEKNSDTVAETKLENREKHDQPQARTNSLGSRTEIDLDCEFQSIHSYRKNGKRHETYKSNVDDSKELISDRLGEEIRDMQANETQFKWSDLMQVASNKEPKKFRQEKCKNFIHIIDSDCEMHVNFSEQNDKGLEIADGDNGQSFYREQNDSKCKEFVDIVDSDCTMRTTLVNTRKRKRNKKSNVRYDGCQNDGKVSKYRNDKTIQSPSSNMDSSTDNMSSKNHEGMHISETHKYDSANSTQKRKEKASQLSLDESVSQKKLNSGTTKSLYTNSPEENICFVREKKRKKHNTNEQSPKNSDICYQKFKAKTSRHIESNEYELESGREKLEQKELEIRHVQTDTEAQEGTRESELEHEKIDFDAKILSKLEIKNKKRKRKISHTEMIQETQDTRNIDTNSEILKRKLCDGDEQSTEYFLDGILDSSHHVQLEKQHNAKTKQSLSLNSACTENILEKTVEQNDGIVPSFDATEPDDLIKKRNHTETETVMKDDADFLPEVDEAKVYTQDIKHGKTSPYGDRNVLIKKINRWRKELFNKNPKKISEEAVVVQQEVSEQHNDHSHAHDLAITKTDSQNDPNKCSKSAYENRCLMPSQLCEASIDELEPDDQISSKISEMGGESFQLENIENDSLNSEDFVIEETFDPKELSLSVPFSVPPHHQHLTDAKQELEASNLGIALKKGPFNKEEDKQIMNNWAHFCKVHNLKVNPEDFFNIQKIRKEERLKFLQFLSHGLDTRKLHRVHMRFKTLFKKNMVRRGRYTAEEDAQILDYLKKTKSNTPYKDLADMFNRTNLSVQRRHETLTKARNTGKVEWNVRSMAKFVAKMMRLKKVKEVSDLKEVELTTEQWKKLSKKFDYIPIERLRRAWKVTIYPRLFVESVDTLQMKKDIVTRLYESDINDWKMIDWKSITEKYAGFTAEKVYMMFRQTMLRHVPKEKREDVRECLSYLMHNVIEKNKLKPSYTIKRLVTELSEESSESEDDTEKHT